MEFVEAVRKCLDDPAGGISILDEPDPLDFSKLQQAVVIFHAAWSPPSAMVIRDYAAAYQRFSKSPGSAIGFYILNWDKLTPAYVAKLPGPLGGWGETFLVKDGLIPYSIPRYLKTFENELERIFTTKS